MAACIYLLAVETTAIARRQIRYFNSVTRLFNIITPVLIIINVWREDREVTNFWTIQTWAAISIWFRFLLYLRTINTFSWLIRMITQCLIDMVTFAFVLLIGVMAFSDAFKSIEKKLQIRGKLPATDFGEDPSAYDRYLKQYVNSWQKSYRTMLGDFDPNVEFYEENDWVVFFICTIFNIILLLNLLIAIISQTFENISETALETGYKEKVIQMCIMQDTVFGMMLWNQKDDPVELAFIAKVISQTDAEEKTSDEKIDELNDKINQNHQKMLDINKELATKLDEIQENLLHAIHHSNQEKKDNSEKDVASVVQ